MGRRRDRLTFVPFYSSIRQVWGNAHVLVMASRLEGLPLALAEALTLGSPAVVTDVADCAISYATESIGLSLPPRLFLPMQNPWSAFGNAALSCRRRVPAHLNVQGIFFLTIQFGLLLQPSLLRYPTVGTSFTTSCLTSTAVRPTPSTASTI
jgi:hypothetical protein